MNHANATVAGILYDAAQSCPDRLAVVSPSGQGITYAALVDRGLRLGHALLDGQLGPGNRVAAWMEDSVEYVQLYVACALAGLVLVPINKRFTEHEARQIVEHAEPAALVFSASLGARVSALAKDFPAIRTIGVESAPVAQDQFEELIGTGANEPLPTPSPEDLYIIGYTSGTTGPAKGAMLTQGSVATLARMNTVSYRLPVGSVAALTGSMSFVAVVPSHIISHFYARGTVHLLGRWDVESLLVSIERHQANFTYIPSPLIQDFADAAATDPSRWQSLDTVLHSASKVAAGQLRRLADVIGPRLVEGWGMTENSGGLVTATTPADVRCRPAGLDRLGTVGRAVPEVVVRIVDSGGGHLPHDGTTVGEIIFRSPALMAGYWKNPQATQAALRDGWYYSGDLGTIDADGYVCISDRRADLIISGGMNIYPYEVEECILRLAGVAACAVVGTTHERWGQAVVAVVVRDAGSDLDEAGVVEHCRTWLASYKKPTRVVFVDSLPTTSSLKVSRHAVRELLS